MGQRGQVNFSWHQLKTGRLYFSVNLGEGFVLVIFAIFCENDVFPPA
jgi:hypothetical protein